MLTIEGEIIHEKAHDAYVSEKRKNAIVSFGMPVISASLGIYGVCDIVEFDRDEDKGVPLAGRKGKYTATPVEYKRGRKRTDDADRLQLCGQALCLEEMLGTEIKTGYIFHYVNRRREEVDIDSNLRERCLSIIAQIRKYRGINHTPKAKYNKACESCSIMDICAPKIFSAQNVAEYIASYVGEK